MMRTKDTVAGFLVVLACVLTAAGCASQRGGSGSGATATPQRMIPEPGSVPKTEDVLPDYVPEKSWEYTSMPSPEPSGKPGVRLDDVAFDAGSSALTREGIAVCRQVAKWMRENPKLDVLIVGHASRLEGQGDGMEIGRRRAEAARNFLVRDLGIPVNRLRVSTFGNRFSKAEASEPSLQRVERRIEFWVM